MAKAEKYKAVSSQNLDAFNAEISDLIQQGWSLRGDLVVVITTVDTEGSTVFNREVVIFNREMVYYKKENESITTGRPD